MTPPPSGSHGSTQRTPTRPEHWAAWSPDHTATATIERALDRALRAEQQVIAQGRSYAWQRARAAERALMLLDEGRRMQLTGAFVLGVAVGVSGLVAALWVLSR